MLKLSMPVAHRQKVALSEYNRTLQDRLTKDMRLAGISTIEAANVFVQSGYMDRHNKKFAEEAAQSGNAHRPVAGLDLRNVFCIKEDRVLQQDFTLSYKNRQLQLLKHQKTVIRPKEKIVVHEHLDGSISLWIRGVRLAFEELGLRSSKVRNAVDYVRKHKDDCEASAPMTTITKSIGAMSLNEFLKSKESRVKTAWPAAEANSHV